MEKASDLVEDRLEVQAPPKDCVMKNAGNMGDFSRRGSPSGMMVPDQIGL